MYTKPVVETPHGTPLVIAVPIPLVMSSAVSTASHGKCSNIFATLGEFDAEAMALNWYFLLWMSLLFEITS